ncbi:MAG: hypothetical protein ABDH66_02115 [Bacteroidia bacterium]
MRYGGAIIALIHAQVRIRSVSVSELQQLSGTMWQRISFTPVTPIQKTTGTFAIRCLAGQPKREYVVKSSTIEFGFPEDEHLVNDPSPPPVPHVANKYESFHIGRVNGIELILAQGLYYDRGCEGDKVKRRSTLCRDGGFRLEIEHPRGTSVSYFSGPSREIMVLVPNPKEPIIIANLDQGWFDRSKRADQGVGMMLRKAGVLREDAKNGLYFCGTFSLRSVPGRSNACLLEVRSDGYSNDPKVQSNSTQYYLVEMVNLQAYDTSFHRSIRFVCRGTRCSGSVGAAGSARCLCGHLAIGRSL